MWLQISAGQVAAESPGIQPFPCGLWRGFEQRQELGFWTLMFQLYFAVLSCTWFFFCLFFGVFFFSLGLHLSVELGDKSRAKSCDLLSLPILGVDLQGFVLRKFSQVCGTEFPQAQDGWLCPSLMGSASSDVMLKSTVLGVFTPWI